MNKALIIVLAVCLVSTQAFVKRDAPAEPNKGLTGLEDINKKIETFTNEAKTKLQETFSNENIQKTLTEVQNNINKMLDEFKKSATTNKP